MATAAGPPIADSKEVLIRDPLHGYIEPTTQEVKLIDTPAFQRLRSIKQLANTYLVFPGATHSRFEHSLGTLSTASRILSRLQVRDKDGDDVYRQIRLAALLHDLGHGPFSHVSEDIVARTIHLEKAFKNVLIALDAFLLDDDIRNHLGSDVDGVIELLKLDTVGVLHEIVDGALDADKMDYLVRDSHYCGVPYGVPDNLRLLYSLRRVKDTSTGVTSLGISDKGVEAVQALHIARYEMHRIVYNHKVRRIADAMLVRATMLAIADGKALDSECFAYSAHDKDFLKSYFELNDAELVRRVIAGGKTGGKIMECLSRRQLFKAAYQVDIDTLHGTNQMNVLKLNVERTKRLEEEIARTAHVDPDLVIVDRQSIDNPTYREPVGAQPKLARILVDRQPHPWFIDEMPGIWTSEIKAMVNKLWVFTPKDFKDQVKGVAETIIPRLGS